MKKQTNLWRTRFPTYAYDKSGSDNWTKEMEEWAPSLLSQHMLPSLRLCELGGKKMGRFWEKK